MEGPVCRAHDTHGCADAAEVEKRDLGGGGAGGTRQRDERARKELPQPCRRAESESSGSARRNFRYARTEWGGEDNGDPDAARNNPSYLREGRASRQANR